MPGLLSVVATPIGNLEDITLRAIHAIKTADIVACEDTRVTSKLLAGLGIRAARLAALHEHTDAKKIAGLVQEMQSGAVVAYVSDAGTPGMNDPGGKLVEAAFAAGIRVEPLPGPSALTAAISVCGFPMDDFQYLGFVPHKKGRETFFRNVADREGASIFLESTHRIEKALTSLKATLEQKRLVFVGREMTKMHETLYRGTIDEVIETLHATSSKGEFVIIIAPKRFHV